MVIFPFNSLQGGTAFDSKPPLLRHMSLLAEKRTAHPIHWGQSFQSMAAQETFDFFLDFVDCGFDKKSTISKSVVRKARNKLENRSRPKISVKISREQTRHLPTIRTSNTALIVAECDNTIEKRNPWELFIKVCSFLH